MLNYRKATEGNIIQLTTFLMERNIFKEKHLNIVISENKFSKPTYIILPILIFKCYFSDFEKCLSVFIRGFVAE